MTTFQLGIRIRERRKQLQLSQAQLADLAQCSIPSIIAAERGKPTQRLDKLLSILTVLGLNLKLGEDDS